MNEIHLLIGGERRRATDGASFERRNPLDHGVATRAPAATAAGRSALTSELAGATTCTGAKQPAFIGTSSSMRQRTT